jgi:hypothetical protein
MRQAVEGRKEDRKKAVLIRRNPVICHNFFLYLQEQ